MLAYLNWEHVCPLKYKTYWPTHMEILKTLCISYYSLEVSIVQDVLHFFPPFLGTTCNFFYPSCRTFLKKIWKSGCANQLRRAKWMSNLRLGLHFSIRLTQRQVAPCGCSLETCSHYGLNSNIFAFTLLKENYSISFFFDQQSKQDEVQ